MTIGQTEPVNIVYGNNLATKFDYDFYIETEEQLVVEHTNFSGVTTVLTYGVDYSIDGIGNEDGGQINFPLQGSTYETLGWNESTDEKEMLVISLSLPFEQAAEFDISGDLNKKNLEKALDYQMRCTQILNRKLRRAILVQEGADSKPEELIASIEEAKLTSQSFAQVAEQKAIEANASAISAGEEATIATQLAAEVAATHEQALTDIEDARASAAQEITVGREEIASNLSTATASLNNTYSTNSNKLKSEYNTYTSNLGNEYQATMKAYDRLYKGVDLEVKFASEIAQYGNVYAWLEARKNANNYDGIHIGDYFHTSLKAGTIAGYSIPAQNFKCRIIGLNTYKSCADNAIGNMIYVSTDEVIDTPIKWNPTDNNNGTNNIKSPWLASAMYAILNGVNNYDTSSGYNKAAHGANGGAGIISLLPSELQAVLKQKRNILDERYSASGLITGGTGWNWADMGKLWLPNEIEVYGCGIRSNVCQTQGFWFPEAGLSIQFPWFANNCENRIKRNSSNGRCNWWLSSVASNYSTYVCFVSFYGNASYSAATYAAIYAPLCFCI